jgi:hypothetical protein
VLTYTYHNGASRSDGGYGPPSSQARERFARRIQSMNTDLILHAGAMDIADCILCQAGSYQTGSGQHERALRAGVE